MSDVTPEEVAEAIIAAIDGDDFANVRAETEAMENVHGGAFFDVAMRGRRFVVAVTEMELP